MDASLIKSGLAPLGFAVFLVLASSFVLKFIAHRRKYAKMPGPPHSFLFGHLLVMGKMMAKVPMDLHPHVVMSLIAREYNLKGLFVIDTWPISPTMIIVADPSLAAQVIQTKSLPKNEMTRGFIEHLVGQKSLITAEGAKWKALRTMFNPGFSSAHLITAVSGIVDDVLVFTQKLSQCAKSGEVICLEEHATRLTIDIIGRVAMDTELNSQSGENDLVTAFRKQVLWTPKAVSVNPFVNLNPASGFMKWYYGRQMDQYLGKYLDDRFASGKQGPPAGRRKRVIDLALDMYAEENNGAGADRDFKRAAIDNIKSFVFAGHDTTSSTICYVYYLLGEHPEALKRVCAEYDEVFGTDPSEAANMIKNSPHITNQLPYTTAVIKEVLRLYPAATTVRQGDPDIIMNDNGTIYPTIGENVWVNNHTISRRADIYPSPDEFDPERFMPPNEVTKDAWRPFEKGPRNCIGQELAMLETKIIMALTLRTFAFELAYDEYDALIGRKPNGGVTECYGTRAYQTLLATAKPKDGMPMRVTMRAT